MAITKTFDILNINGVKGYIRDSWARRKIVALQQTIADIAVPTKTSDITNDSGYVTTSDVQTAIQTYLASKFAVLSGTYPTSGEYTSTISYPTGFTLDNSVVVSFESLYGTAYMRSGDGVYASTGRALVDLSSSGIRLYNDNSAGYGKTWKVVLMRTDI